LVKEQVGDVVAKFNERMDAMEVANKKQMNAGKKMTFKSALQEAIEGGAIEGMLKGNSRSASLVVKADMTIGADFTGEVIPADRVAGYKYDPTRPVHVRQLIPQGSTASDVVRFVKESGYSNGAAATAEGVTLTQSDFDMTASDANVRKIDLAGEFADAVDSANQFDVLIASLNQLAIANYSADTIMLHPTDFHKILLLKDSTAEYIKKDVYQGLQPQFNGVRVVLNTAITSGTFLVGNFAQGTQLWVRDNVNVEFFREDGTNVRDGFVTVRVSERVALTNYLPNAFVYGTFSTAIASLETP
jgi:hypothetical protein